MDAKLKEEVLKGLSDASGKLEVKNENRFSDIIVWEGAAGELEERNIEVQGHRKVDVLVRKAYPVRGDEHDNFWRDVREFVDFVSETACVREAFRDCVGIRPRTKLGKMKAPFEAGRRWGLEGRFRELIWAYLYYAGGDRQRARRLVGARGMKEVEQARDIGADAYDCARVGANLVTLVLCGWLRNRAVLVGSIARGEWKIRRKGNPVTAGAEKAAEAGGGQTQNEMTFADVVLRWDVPFPALTKATKLSPTDPNHLASRKDGRNRKVDTDVARKWCENYIAKRDARQRGALDRDPKQIRSALKGFGDSQRKKRQ